MNTQAPVAKAEPLEIWRSDWFVATGLAVLALMLYLGMRLQVHNQVVDFTNFAAAVQREGVSDKWFYGDHLIYVFLLNWLHHALSNAFPSLDATTTAQVFNSVVACLGVGVFYILARRFVREQWLGVGLAITLMFSYQYWLFAADVEVHAPAALFYLLSLLLAFRIPSGARVWVYAVLGVLTATAVLFHVIVLLFVPLVVGLMIMRANAQSADPMKGKLGKAQEILAYCGTTAAIVIMPYWYVATRVLHLNSWREIYLWLLPNLADTANVGATSLRSAVILLARRIPLSLIGRLMWVATPANQLMPGKECLDASRYLVRNVPTEAALVLAGCGVLSGALLAVIGIISVPGFVRLVRNRSEFAMVLIGWVVSYAALIGVFMPGSSEHWGIYWLPGFLLIIGLGLSETTPLAPSRRRLVQGLGGAMLLFLLIGNGSNILVQTSPGNDLYMERLKWYRGNSSPADLVISGGDWMWTGYLDYYLRAQVVPLRKWAAQIGYSHGLQELEALIEKTRGSGGRIFVTHDALQRDNCSEKITEEESEMFASFRQSMLPRLSCFQSADTSVCEVLE